MGADRQPIVAIVGGATAGAETAGLLAERGVRTVVFEQNPRPYGKIEDGLPRWHTKLRRKEFEAISDRLARPGVDFVPCTKIGRDIELADLAAWGFSAIILAHGAWRDRPLPIEGADRFVGHGLVYQNPFIYWFNHYAEVGYDGPRYDIPDGALVVGGGLASIDVMKVLQIELVRQALAARGVDEDVLQIEHEGVPAALAEHDLTWNKLGLLGATLYYRRRIEDMPLAEGPDTDDPIRLEKVGAVRRKILEKAMQKYCFTTEPLHAPVGLLTEGDRLVGLRFQRTRVEGGRAVLIEGAVHDVRAPLVVSSIGSVPESMPGIAEHNLLYEYADPELGRVKGFESVFGAGNVVTGKGNIAASRRHSILVATRVAEEFLGVGEPSVEAMVARLPAPSPEQVEQIARRVRERQTAVGYTSYREWLARVTPPDLA
jgi:NADPH-dependent glutamate synthase beta subunit-like oxidoreductase